MLRILIVDDSEASAQTLGWMVEIFGYDIKLAHNGQDALALAKSFKPHVVLLDIGLPGMNGYEVCQRLRNDPEIKNLVIIAQTGWGEDQHKTMSQEAGFDYYMVKPIEMEKLRQLLLSLEPTVAGMFN